MDQSPDLIKFTDTVFSKNANFVSNMAPYRYTIHGHCHLIHGESVIFVTYWTSHGSGESNM